MKLSNGIQPILWITVPTSASSFFLTHFCFYLSYWSRVNTSYALCGWRVYRKYIAELVFWSWQWELCIASIHSPRCNLMAFVIWRIASFFFSSVPHFLAEFRNFERCSRKTFCRWLVKISRYLLKFCISQPKNPCLWLHSIS